MAVRTRTDDDRFRSIQRMLVPLWHSLASLNSDEQTIVVVPSLTLELPPSIAAAAHIYEERSLFLLFLLRQPRARMIFLTSRPVSPAIVDYYLALLPGVIPSHARARLELLSPADQSPEPLTQKLLRDAPLLDRIRALVPDPRRAHLVPYVSTELERDLVVRLGIPMYGADPSFASLGTKSGSRRMFREAGVAHPAGAEDLRDLEDAVEAIAKLRAERPGVDEVVVKLDEGVSGMGNAVVDLKGLDDDAGREAVRERLRRMRTPAGSFEAYAEAFARHGGVVEERLTGRELRSPSVQLRGTPLGELEVLSTHDQLLGGADGQTYEGCRFPADEAYAPAITRDAVAVGDRLVRGGVMGRFAIDFVVVSNDAGGWSPYAIELNLRKGGTTHPFLTLQFLTAGAYEPETARFHTPAGAAKCFVASDYVHSDAYRGLTLDRLFDIVVRNGLHFDQSHQTGVVLHSMSGLAERGRMGLTAVGDSHEHADEIFAAARRALDAETRTSIR